VTRAPSVVCLGCRVCQGCGVGVPTSTSSLPDPSMAGSTEGITLFLAAFLGACVVMCVFHVFVVCIWVLLGL
jgi:hypothetical protein